MINNRVKLIVKIIHIYALNSVMVQRDDHFQCDAMPRLDKVLRSELQKAAKSI